MKNNEILLEMKNVTKIFPGVKALDDVSFDLRKGEVHALLGENGAGKSTLIKVLGGIHAPEEGELFVEGKPVKIETVEDAHLNGISIIHQELVLVPHMSVYENIFLGKEKTNKIFLNKQDMIRKTQEMLDAFDLSFKPTTIVDDLSIASQQMVEIIKALSFNAKIIVMDEPTSSISDTEVEQLFNTIRELKNRGVGIIYISHKMSELDEICDRVTILRDGEYISTHNVEGTSRDTLISEMVGRKIDNFYVRENVDKGKVILKADNITGKDFHNVSFDIKPGEIVGFAGLIGSGRSEVMKAIYGLDAISEGSVYFEDKLARIKDPKSAFEHGIALVPENRKEEGLFLEKDVRYNTSLGVLHRFIKGIRVDNKFEKNIVEGYINTLKIKTPSQTHLIRNLSGGNQQKVVISRWLATNPKVLILDEPTRGIDIGAKTEIYTLMNELTKNGMAIIMISSELPEIINMSDRVYVMSAGTIVGEVSGDEMTQENIMTYATQNM